MSNDFPVCPHVKPKAAFVGALRYDCVTTSYPIFVDALNRFIKTILDLDATPVEPIDYAKSILEQRLPDLAEQHAPVLWAARAFEVNHGALFIVQITTIVLQPQHAALGADRIYSLLETTPVIANYANTFTLNFRMSKGDDDV